MKKLIFLVISILCYYCVQEPEGKPVPAIHAFADSMFNISVDSGKIAGASILIEHHGEIVLSKSYGFANLEFAVPMPEEASFEIGSVTKQFTAVAILKLVEAGKLSLEDDFTKYIDFDTRGKKIKVGQLLNHTSGIPGYTELPHFWELSVHTYDRDSLVRFVEQEDFLFEPGEQMIYNNTAYFLLGLIIEKASGKSYEDYLKENIVDPLEMKNTYYSSNSKVVKNKAYGYQFSMNGLLQRPYLDHTWPYAAGSLSSTARDLLTWLKALHHGEVLHNNFYQQLITPGTLNDGTPLRYAMGLTHFDEFGHEVISHGGGINGFLSETRYYPQDDLYIICLVNTTGPIGAGYFTDNLVWKLLEKEKLPSVPIDFDLETIDGKYSGQVRGQKITWQVTTDNDAIIMHLEEGERPDTIKTYIGNNTWRDGNSILKFGNDELRMDRISGYYILKKNNGN